MLVRDTVVALAANPKSCESFYLIKIKREEKETREDVDDSFRHVIKKEMKHLEEAFLERKFDSDNVYAIPQKLKIPFFFSESAVFLSVQLESKNRF